MFFFALAEKRTLIRARGSSKTDPEWFFAFVKEGWIRGTC